MATVRPVISNPQTSHRVIDHIEEGTKDDNNVQDMYVERKMASSLDGMMMRNLDLRTFIIIFIIEIFKLIVYIAVLVDCATSCVLPDHTATLIASPIISAYFSFDVACKVYRALLWYEKYYRDDKNQLWGVVGVVLNSCMMIVATIAYSRTLEGIVNFAINAAALIAIGNVEVAMFPNFEELRFLPNDDVFINMTSRGKFWKGQAVITIAGFVMIYVAMLVFNLAFYPQACQPTCPCYSSEVCEYFKANNCVRIFYELNEMCSWNTTVLTCYNGVNNF